MDQKRVGVIGTGRMGNAFAWNLIKAGHKVYVYDIDPKATQNLIAQGAILSAPIGDGPSSRVHHHLPSQK